MPPTFQARIADRAIACLRKALEELAAGRLWNALAMVADAQGKFPIASLGIHDSSSALAREIPKQ
jgi:hypothetical protein